MRKNESVTQVGMPRLRTALQSGANSLAMPHQRTRARVTLNRAQQHGQWLDERPGLPRFNRLAMAMLRPGATASGEASRQETAQLVAQGATRRKRDLRSRSCSVQKIT
jgi:hypothetical protein